MRTFPGSQSFHEELDVIVAVAVEGVGDVPRVSVLAVERARGARGAGVAALVAGSGGRGWGLGGARCGRGGGEWGPRRAQPGRGLGAEGERGRLRSELGHGLLGPGDVTVHFGHHSGLGAGGLVGAGVGRRCVRRLGCVVDAAAVVRGLGARLVRVRSWCCAAPSCPAISCSTPGHKLTTLTVNNDLV